MTVNVHHKLDERKRRVLDRIKNRPCSEQERPMIAASNLHYELADRVHGLAAGGIGAMVLVTRMTGLISDIDGRLHLLKRHIPYHESDHVLNIAFNILAGGTKLEHLELRRNDEVYLDALGAIRLPDPTTAGDFCRRFGKADILELMDAINEARLRVWRQQGPKFFDRAVIDADGTLVGTGAACKEGVDMAYDGTWGYHPLVVSLSNTQEPLFLVNRSGNRPSHEDAAEYLDRAIELCRRGGFRSILLRGDTDFTQTTHLDRWNGDGVHFLFGIDARANLISLAQQLPESAYKRLDRPEGSIKTKPRQRPKRHKSEKVRDRGFKRISTLDETVAEFQYKPRACKQSYRVTVLRKRLATSKGQLLLFEKYRYFFFITNVEGMTAQEVVLEANGRCNQENLLAQLKGGVHALATPVDNLLSNWAYMVMASLAWSLKAWAALLTPEEPQHASAHQAEKKQLLGMEFRTFCAAMIQMPCQIVRGGRRVVYRLLSWNPWQGTFFRLVERLRGEWLC